MLVTQAEAERLVKANSGASRGRWQIMAYRMPDGRIDTMPEGWEPFGVSGNGWVISRRWVPAVDDGFSEAR